MNQVMNAQGEWVQGEPSAEGQRFRKIIDANTGAYVESIFTLVPRAVSSKITRLAFKLRLLPSERTAIRNAAKVNDEIYDFMDLLSEATYIDLSLPETISGINAMVAAGLLTSQRAYQILNNPVQSDELYKG